MLPALTKAPESAAAMLKRSMSLTASDASVDTATSTTRDSVAILSIGMLRLIAAGIHWLEIVGRCSLRFILKNLVIMSAEHFWINSWISPRTGGAEFGGPY